MSRIIKFVLVAALLTALSSCHKSAPVPDASHIATAKAIAKFWGATKVTNQNDAAAEAFFDAVEAGEPDALLAYPVIYQHLSGGGDEAQISLSLALAKNPSGVLAVLNSAAKIKYTCVSNLIEPEPGVERAWYRNAERALSKIDAKSPLAARRDACLDIMRSDEQHAGASAQLRASFDRWRSTILAKSSLGLA